MNSVGKRYECGGCGKILIVTRGGDGELQCCGGPVVRTDDPAGVAKRSPVPGTAGGNRIGQRLGCTTCGTEVIVVKAGIGDAACHSAAIAPVVAAQIASAD